MRSAIFKLKIELDQKGNVSTGRRNSNVASSMNISQNGKEDLIKEDKV